MSAAGATSADLPHPADTGGFRFPKWYADYLRGNGRSSSLVVIGETHRSHRLTFLQQDGSSNGGDQRRVMEYKRQRFPTLRNGHFRTTRQTGTDQSLPKLAIGQVHELEEEKKSKKKQHQQEQEQQQPPLPLGISSLSERYNSFATAVTEPGFKTHRRVAGGHQTTSMLYSNLRCATRARLCDFRKLAPVTIPSVVDIRRNFNDLPPICVKKIV